MAEPVEVAEPVEQSRPSGGWLARHSSVATRLALSALTISVATLVITALVAATGAGGDAEELLRGRLTSLRGTKAAEIESYFAALEAQAASLAAGSMVTDGVQGFTDAFEELQSLDFDALTNERRAVGAFYVDVFAPALGEVRDQRIAPESFFTQNDSAAVYLQSEYIAQNEAGLGNERLVSDAQDGSTWTEIHRELHPTMRQIADRLEVSDILLIDPDNDNIVYSVEKRPDFATSLDAGTFSNSLLARLIDEVEDSGEPGITDFSSYAPALDEPTLFIAAPVFDEDELVGILATAVNTDRVDEIMTRDWRMGRFGETGEVYLVGSDGRMRSISRPFTEDSAAYLTRVEELGTVEPTDRQRMEALDTTVLFQPVDDDAVDAAFAIDEGLIETTNYLGEPVFTAYRPVDIGRGPTGLDWVILAEQGRAEVNGPVDEYRRDSLVLAAVFVAALAFLVVIWANSFVSPVRRISWALGQARSGDLDTEVPAAGAREFRDLATSFNQMVDDLAARRHRVSNALEAKVDMLRTVLPPAAARSVDKGDRSLLETVPQATVVVLVVKGIDELVRSRSAESNRELLHRLIDEFDRLAEINGLERVKVLGDTYYAACGLGTPYLDHAPRAVRFAQQAEETVRRLRVAEGLDIHLAAGAHSGIVTVGLTGGSRLVYDLWGDTVTAAHKLARRAGAGEIQVSDVTQERLPSDTATTRVGAPDDEEAAWVVANLPITEGGET